MGTLVAATVVIAALVAFRLFHRHSMIDSTREWARLAPIPADAEDFAIEARGSMFTREFRASFRATGDSIARWLQDSPGTREATRTRTSQGRWTYSIRPGGGAQFAEVTVDDQTGVVTIRVYWS
jgi:hypothetical protein